MHKPSLFKLKEVLSVLVLLAIWPGSSALAQVDLTGMWSPLVHEDAPQRGNGSQVGDFTGLPMSQANRLRSASWAADMMEVAEWVCRPYSSDDGLYAAPAQLHIWKEVDNTTQQVLAYHTHIFYHEQEQTIWMDGRAHPPDDALHTWAGFSTGEWEGNTLLYTTTHLKESFIERNGPVRSDRATVRSRFRRYGNYLIATVITYDPVYLTEPFVRTETWVYSPEEPMHPYPCEEATETVVPRGKSAALFTRKESHTDRVCRAIRDTARSGARRRGNHVPRVHRHDEEDEGAAAPGKEVHGKLRGGRPVKAIAVILGIVAVLSSPLLHAQGNQNGADGEIHILPVQGNVYMLVGAGGNITVQAGDDGILLVDSGLASMSDKVLAAIHSISNRPLIYIVNTDESADHIGGNRKDRRHR